MEKTLIVYVDGTGGGREGALAVFPDAIIRRDLEHIKRNVRNSKFVLKKGKKKEKKQKSRSLGNP